MLGSSDEIIEYPSGDILNDIIDIDYSIEIWKERRKYHG